MEAEVPVLVIGAGPVAEEPAVLGDDPEVIAAGEVAPAPAEVGAPAAVVPKETEVVFPRQLLEVPAPTVKAADCAT